jgi:mannose-1-phosphate guanylyltransferase/mannose-6-phosphate isomerase
MTPKIIPVILCGGSGTRLWPASREGAPKQFLRLVDERTLLQNTALRALEISGASAGDVVTVTIDALAPAVQAQLAAVDPAATLHILREPEAKNTAAAIACAALYARAVFGDAMLWVLPSDHHIGDEGAMKAAFARALGAASLGRLVTFGISPTRAETGYGYIRAGDALGGGAHAVDAFVEKPDAETARRYVASGGYLWNSGMFLFGADVLLEEFAAHAPEVLRHARAAMAAGVALDAPAPGPYSLIPETPFDKAVMEKSTRVAVVPCDPDWSDIGSWESLWELRRKDARGNAVAGRAIAHDTRNCLIQSEGTRLVACSGVEDLVIVDSGDTLLIARRPLGEALRALARAARETAAPPPPPRVDAQPATSA